MQAWPGRRPSVRPVSVRYGSGVNVPSTFPAFLQAQLFHPLPSHLAANLTSSATPPPQILCQPPSAQYCHNIMTDHSGNPSSSLNNHHLRRVSSPFHYSAMDQQSAFLATGLPHSNYAYQHHHNELRTKSDGAMLMYQQAMPALGPPTFYPFRPNSPLIQAPHQPPPPPKVETPLPVPTPAVLYTQVDPAEFEQTDYEDWMMATTEYTGTSPTNATSPDSLPQTPLAPFAYNEADEVHAANARLQELRDLEDPDLHNPYVLKLPRMENALRQAEHVISPAEMYLHHHPAEGPGEDEDMEPSSEEDEEMESSSQQSSVEPESRSRAARRSIRDDQLLEMRRDGLSYKEIKRVGSFREAESTLRGRVRTLTKEKHERVRKPAWKARDCTLLRRAVAHFSRGGSVKRGRAGKVPWKQVSDWMLEKGSSYAFGPATCAKKYNELQGDDDS